MRNIALLVAYDGGSFSGWQVQRPTVPTVQGELERVVAQITQQTARVRGAGRTDAGVHAEGQLANFITGSTLDCDRLLRGINALLCPAVRVRALRDVPSDFDSRRNNHGKHYRYRVWNARLIPPPLRGRAYAIHRPLDALTMADAARTLVGHHDFAAFRAADCDRETTQRTLYRCTVSVERSRAGAMVSIDVEGTAFLKNMVRIIAGTLLEVGQGRRSAESVGALLAGGKRTEAGITAPARGLTLVRVFTDAFAGP